MSENVDFGRYEITSLLGKGAFGTVYEGFDRKLQRSVAIKVINEGITGVSLQRFTREADICLRLRHPNIVTIFDASVKDGKPFIVMEKLEAQELAELIDTIDIGESGALSIVVQLANAVDYLQKEGILHRDIKPHNVMVTKDGRAILMDFNLGFSIDMTAITATGVVLGTPVYMAPELWHGASFDIRTEIYALGLVLYEMLTNSSITEEAFLRMRMGQPLIAPSKVNKKLTNEYDDFLLWVTNPLFQERCSSIHDFLGGLAETSAKAWSAVDKYNPEISSSSKKVRAPVYEKPIAQRGYRRWFVLMVLLLIVLVSLAGFKLLKSPSVKEGQKASAKLVSFCPFSDGCYGTFKAPRGINPSWRILSGKAVLKEGKCVAKGPFWVAQSAELRGNGEYIFQLVDDHDVLFSRNFQTVANVFESPIRAYVGERKVILRWQLKNEVEAKISGSFKGQGIDDEAFIVVKGRNKATFVAKRKAMQFDYVFSIGDRTIVKSSLEMGLVARRNLKDFPEKPNWKTRMSLLLDGGLVVDSKEGITFLAVDRNERGPIVSRRWSIQFTDYSKILQLLPGEGDWFTTVLRERGAIYFVRINYKKRLELGSLPSPAVGELAGEFKKKIPSRGIPSKVAMALHLEHGLVVLVNVEKHGGTTTSYLIDYRSVEVKMIEGPSLGTAEALWLGRLGEGLVCISALKGAVIQTSLAVDSQKTKIEKGSIQSLFQGTDKGLLLTIGSQDKDASEQAQKLKKVELVVNGLSNGRWSIRIGNTIGYFSLDTSKSQSCGPRTILPVYVAERISSALEHSDSLVSYVAVETKGSIFNPSRANLYTVDLTKKGIRSLKKKEIGQSALHTGYEAICGGVCCYEGQYFIPALENVHIVSQKSGLYVGKLYARWRPNYAIVIEDTLFVPLNIRRFLAMDLMNEF